MEYPAVIVERSFRTGLRAGRAIALAALLIALAGCGGGDGGKAATRSPGVALAARLPSDDALNIAIADVTAIRRTLGMPAGAIPPTKSDEDDLVFLNEITPALGVVASGEFPQPIVDAAMERAGWVAGVAGDEGVTAFKVNGDTSDFKAMLREAGMKEDDGEWVAEDSEFAIALGDGLMAFADDAGDAEPVVADDPGDPPEELGQLDGDGELITLARFGAACIDAVATIDTPGLDGEIAFFTTATPDPGNVTNAGIATARPRVVGDAVRVPVRAADTPAGEPPALLALQSDKIDYDCDG